MKNLNSLILFIGKRFPRPERWWTRRSYEKRCYEIDICERIAYECMDHPNINPANIIENHMYEIEEMRSHCSNKYAQCIFNDQLGALNVLYCYMSK